MTGSFPYGPFAPGETGVSWEEELEDCLRLGTGEFTEWGVVGHGDDNASSAKGDVPSGSNMTATEDEKAIPGR